MLRTKHTLFIADALLAYLALQCGYFLRFAGVGGGGDGLQGDHEILVFICYVLAILLSSYFFELYFVEKFGSRKFIVLRSVAVALATFFILSAIYYLIPAMQLGRGLLVFTLICFTGFQICLRFGVRRFSRASQFATKIIIAGTGELAQKVADVVPRDQNMHSFVRFVRSKNEKSVVPEEHIIGNISQITELIHDYRPHKLIIALTERRGSLPLKDIMHSKMRGVEVIGATSYYEQEMGCLMVENMQPSEFVYTHRFRMTPYMRAYKRIFDVVLSSLGLILAAPLFPFIALAIKLDSAGPLLYKQLRVGEREIEYFVYKFRTMADNAESDTGAVWAVENDPRVTKVGQFMRKTRLDEIPQLYNVLKGDMSFIGPRPERMTFVERLKKNIPYYSIRHFVKPGLTGWAQVRYPYGASEEDALEKLRYDLFYIKNYSVFLDFKIILDTVRVVTSGFGGR